MDAYLQLQQKHTQGRRLQQALKRRLDDVCAELLQIELKCEVDALEILESVQRGQLSIKDARLLLNRKDLLEFVSLTDAPAPCPSFVQHNGVTHMFNPEVDWFSNKTDPMFRAASCEWHISWSYDIPVTPAVFTVKSSKPASGDMVLYAGDEKLLSFSYNGEPQIVTTIAAHKNFRLVVTNWTGLEGWIYAISMC